MLVLVHHADAVGPDVDPQRPLSTPGRAHAQRLVDQLAAARRAGAPLAGWQPAAIWHSGKLRARQTAEPFLALNPFAQFKMVGGLRPDDPPQIILTALAMAPSELVLVSHMPLLPALRDALTGEGAGFPLHGLVVLERVDEGWRERLRLGGDF
jgi:phosphohistidine phosphatase